MNYPAPLPVAEQVDLCLRAQAGDLGARNRLVSTSMRFVVARASKLHRLAENADIDDLVNDGVFGLIRAIEKYDPTVGANFISYAVHHIDQRIRLGAYHEREVSPSDVARGACAAEYRALVAEGVGAEEAANRIGAARHMKPATVLAVAAALSRKSPRSLDAPLTEDGLTLGDTLAADGDVVVALTEAERDVVVRAVVENFRRTLSARDRSILDERVLADDDDRPTTRALASRLGISHQGVLNIERPLRRTLYRRLRASSRLRASIGRDGPRTDAQLAEYMRGFRRKQRASGQCGQCAEVVELGRALCEAHRRAACDRAIRTRRADGVQPKKYRMVSFQGETMCVSAWAYRLNLTPPMLHWRLKHWSIERALTEPTLVGLRQKTTCKRGHDVASVGTLRLSNGSLLCWQCDREIYKPKQAESRRTRMEANRAAGKCGCGRQPRSGKRLCVACATCAADGKKRRKRTMVVEP